MAAHLDSRARATDLTDIDSPGRVTGGSSGRYDAQFLRAMPEDFDCWAEWGNSNGCMRQSFPTSEA